MLQKYFLNQQAKKDSSIESNTKNLDGLKIEKDKSQAITSSDSSYLKKITPTGATSKKKKILKICGLVAAVLLVAAFIQQWVFSTNKVVDQSWQVLRANTLTLSPYTTQEEIDADLSNLIKASVSVQQNLSNLIYQLNGYSFPKNTSKIDDISSTIQELNQYLKRYTNVLNSVQLGTNLTESEIEEMKKNESQVEQSLTTLSANLGVKNIDLKDIRLSSAILGVKSLNDDLAQKTEEEKKAAEEKAIKDAEALQAEETQVKDVLSSFIQSLINASESGVRSTASQGYINEFDFNSLRSPAIDTNRVKSFRIIELKKDGSNYIVRINITYKSTYTDAVGQQQVNDYTYETQYRLIYSDSAKNWKVDGLEN
jgi:hypothetical protein